MVEYLQQIIDNDQAKNDETINKILEQLNNILNNGTHLLKSTAEGLQETGLQDEGINPYRRGLSNLSQGIKSMLEWTNDQDAQEDKLRKSVDLLFEAGQQILELVTLITRK